MSRLLLLAAIDMIQRRDAALRRIARWKESESRSMSIRRCFRRLAASSVLAACSLFISALCIGASVARAEEGRPNILWIIAEDMGPELECYGAAEVWTPNLNGLAEGGMRYTRAFTTSPVCSTSRSAFMTGMYQMAIGAHNHRSHRDDGFKLPEGVRPLTHWLRDAGYYTANIGRRARPVPGTGKTDWNFEVEGPKFDGAGWRELQANQPFYAQINFPETHRGGAWDSAHRRIPKTADLAKVKLPPYYPDHPIARQDWAQYLNTVMSLDQKVGAVLRHLKSEGLDQNTIIIFFGDHGRAMVRGKQWPYDSGLHVPLIIRWPAALRDKAPAQYKPGAVSEQLISSIDLTATTLALAGVDKPRRMQGRVFLGQNAEPARQVVFGGRDRGDETVDRIRTARDARFRYIRNYYPERPFLQVNRYKEFQYPVIHLLRYLDAKGKLTPAQKALLAPNRPAEELYDLQADPHETRNLAGSPQHLKTLSRLRTVMERWMDDIDDQGRIPEPPEVIAQAEEKMKKNYETRLKKRLAELRAKFEELEKQE